MGKNKIFWAFVAADIVFVICGAIMLGFSVVAPNTLNETPKDGQTALRQLIYGRFPFAAGIANAVFIFATFAASIPGIATPTRGWLKISSYMTVFCSLFSLVLGIYLWILTLKTKEDFLNIWVAQSHRTQDLMETAFQCCGYINSTTPAFARNAMCPSPAAAALTRGCAAPISSFTNIFMDSIFTGVFGMVGVDAVLLLAAACLLKDRKEQARFRHIDQKSGYRGL